MRTKAIALALTVFTLSAPALADHNSKWGEGWAKMPNDIHNTRIDTRRDTTSFRDFVRYGNGADSANRFSTSESRGQQKASSSQRGRPSVRQGQRSRR